MSEPKPKHLFGVLNRIGPNTTLAELHQTFGRYGVRKLDVRLVPGDHYPVNVTMYAAHAAFGTGQTLYEAIDDALARIIHRIGDEIANPVQAEPA